MCKIRTSIWFPLTRQRRPYFSLEQVDRLEQEVADLRRAEEMHATATAARAQTTGELEKYRSRAQQALKRANEITSQTVAENKRLEASLMLCPGMEIIVPSNPIGVDLLYQCDFHGIVVLRVFVGCTYSFFDVPFTGRDGEAIRGSRAAAADVGRSKAAGEALPRRAGRSKWLALEGSIF